MTKIGSCARLTTSLKPSGWYALRTRTRFEKKVSAQLQSKGIEVFLPIHRELHRWSDRMKPVETPLFDGYTFVRTQLFPTDRLEVLKTPGVTAFVNFMGNPAAIPDKQIEDLRRAAEHNLCRPADSFIVGRKVRVRGGALDGLEGHIVQLSSGRMIAISIGPIQRSVLVQTDGYDVELI